MYIVLLLSPLRKRMAQNVSKVSQKGVRIPVKKKRLLETMKTGNLPTRSAKKPKIRVPSIPPIPNKDWLKGPFQEPPHTKFCWNQ